MKPVPGTEQRVECDLLVLAVGLIPENELSAKAGVELDPRTKGPVLDGHFMTSVPGIFAAGNVAVVFDLVDYVSQSGKNRGGRGRGICERRAAGVPRIRPRGAAGECELCGAAAAVRRGGRTWVGGPQTFSCG